MRRNPAEKQKEGEKDRREENVATEYAGAHFCGKLGKGGALVSAKAFCCKQTHQFLAAAIST